MADLTAEQFAQRAFELDLLDERQLREVWAEFGTHNVPLDDLSQSLVRRGLMTGYQVERLMKGERSGFFFGDYKALYQIGTGTYARVYRAAQKKTGQSVAVKVLRHRYAEDPAATGQFLREGTTGLKLRHPNIVPIYDVVTAGRTHYLVMEFLEGQTLRDFLKNRKQLEPAEAVQLMQDIAAGLAYAFDHGVTHRDLSLSNVFVTSRGHAKLVDFGLAAIGDDNEECPNPRTIDYVVLERATGVRRGDIRSDIYFAGTIFYHMLAGRPPLSDVKDRLHRLNVARFKEITPIQQLLPNLPPTMLRIVNKSMELDVNRRYQRPDEMLTDLQTAARRISNPAHGDDETDAPPAPRHSILVVEANAKLQDVFRQRLKESGYRVLVISDPERALARIAEDRHVADCIVVSTGELGDRALTAFNDFADDPRTKRTPAILLLDEEHHDWQGQAKTADHRVVLLMPLRVKELRQTLAKLLGTPSN